MLTVAYHEFHNSKSKQNRKNSLRDIAVMELLFATGMRVSELCGLNIIDIDLTERKIIIYGKGTKERIIQLTNHAVI